MAQVNVLESNYAAEYGRSVGGTINTVTKSGSSEFHGGLYYYFRNTDLNANDFFANMQGLPRSPYRYNNPGYFVGGPVIFPKSDFNRHRDKLFFFLVEEFLARTVPTAVSFQTFPTALERKGDFSQSLDQNGQLIVIRNPATNIPFSGNSVPASLISPQGQALLNLFPMPNTSVATRSYNSVFQVGIDQPRNDQVLRLDWNISSTTTFYFRGIKTDNQAQRGGFGFVLASPAWPQLPVDYQIPAQGIVFTVLHTRLATSRIRRKRLSASTGAPRTRGSPHPGGSAREQPVEP